MNEKRTVELAVSFNDLLAVACASARPELVPDAGVVMEQTAAVHPERADDALLRSWVGFAMDMTREGIAWKVKASDGRQLAEAVIEWAETPGHGTGTVYALAQRVLDGGA